MVHTSPTKNYTIGVAVASTSAGAGATVLYTCPANFTARVVLLNYANVAGTTQTLTVEFYHVEDALYTSLAQDLSVDTAISGKILCSGDVLYLHSGDKLVASTNSANAFDIILSVEELNARYSFAA